MVVAQEDASVILDLLEGNGVAEQGHLMAAGVVVEPEVAESVMRWCGLLFHESVRTTSRGRLSSAGMPRHTAQGFRSA